MNLTLQVKLPTTLGQSLEKKVTTLKDKVDAELKAVEKDLKPSLARAKTGDKRAVEKVAALNKRRVTLLEYRNKLTMASLFRAAARKVDTLPSTELEKLLSQDDVFRGAPKRA